MKQNKKMLFVYNPKAGKAMIRNKLADILDIFTAGGYEITIVPTQRHGDAVNIVKNRSNIYDVVVCSGGDGTLDEVVNGMLQSDHRTPLGYIPAGSTNDFAASLAIPSDMLKAANIIVSGSDFSCDVGSFNDSNFIYVAAFGLFSEISYSTDQQIKNALGHTAYILSGGKSLLNAHAHKLKVTANGETIEDVFIYGMISNSKQVGGFQGIMGPGVELDDGEFEVTLIKDPKTPPELNTILVSLLERNFDNDLMYSFRTSDITIESDEPVSWALDGEDGGAHKKVHIKTLPKAIDIKVIYQ
ncbi:MAG: diacylglycerol kinase family lipid kinase [Lachnospiraceae bacterium]|nr:diacylglycerol kinase family lipid kinase [Lachnospiraceae bacterium]MBR6303988.1 diacylglycerol kinase family lipid kinase [Lachnospiraceae bacterium]MBR6909531.1 diacylglycerol kinase family lipid kinase [Lachnospiraceae bacterium]